MLPAVNTRELNKEHAGEPLSSPARVRARGLEVHYAQDAHIELPDLTLNANQELALVGPSGSGKTTLLHVLAGLLGPTRGEVEIAGEPLTKMPQRRLERFRAQHIGLVFQDLHLVDGYTALENVIVALAAAGVPLGEAKGRARDLLSDLDLAHRLNYLPKRLSTGERQRVAIARATAANPVVLLADEPTANLDRERGAAALDLLRQVARRSNAALIVSTHDPAVKGAFDEVVELG